MKFADGFQAFHFVSIRQDYRNVNDFVQIGQISGVQIFETFFSKTLFWMARNLLWAANSFSPNTKMRSVKTILYASASSRIPYSYRLITSTAFISICSHEYFTPEGNIAATFMLLINDILTTVVSVLAWDFLSFKTNERLFSSKDLRQWKKKEFRVKGPL